MEAPRLRDRPALIVSDSWLGNDGLTLQWTVMITSAANRGWPDDILLLERFVECGLPVASVIRVAKIVTIDCASAAPLGKLPSDLFAEVTTVMRSRLD